MAFSLRSFRRLRTDEKGVTVIEFGVLMPVLVVLVAGTIDLSQGLSDRFRMQQAVNRSLEMLQARPPQIGADEEELDYTYLKQEAATGADVPIAKVTLDRWLECDGNRQGSFEGSCTEGQETARYLELKINKTYAGKLFLKDYPMEAKGALRIQ